MIQLHDALPAMQGALAGARSGDAAACKTYADAYDAILSSGTFYDNVPGDWEDIHLRYAVSFIYALDRTRPAYLSCKDSGRVDGFNHDLAWQAIDLASSVLNPAIDAAKSRLGIQ